SSLTARSFLAVAGDGLSPVPYSLDDRAGGFTSPPAPSRADLFSGHAGQALAEPLVRARSLFGVDQAVAVGVAAADCLRRAQHLTRRDVAVPVAVHLTEPERPRAGRPGPGWPGRTDVGARAHHELVAARHFGAGQAGVAVAVPRRQPGPGRP